MVKHYTLFKKNQYLNLFVFDRYFCLKYSNCNVLFFPKDELLSPHKSSEIGMNDCKKYNDLKIFCLWTLQFDRLFKNHSNDDCEYYDCVNQLLVSN